MLHTTHEDAYDEMDSILRCAESTGYRRTLPYAPGKVVLLDSRPAPGFDPKAKGKAETGKDYEAAADGTDISLFYLAGGDTTEKAKAEAARHSKVRDPREITGKLVSLRRTKDGNILVMVVTADRDVIGKDGTRESGLALRTFSLRRDRTKGVIVALGIDQTLGLPRNVLQAMAEAAKPDPIEEVKPVAVVKGVAEGLKGQLKVGADSGKVVDPNATPLPTPKPDPAPEVKRPEIQK